MAYTSLDCLVLLFKHYIKNFCRFVWAKLEKLQKATERHISCTEHRKIQLLYSVKIVIFHYLLKHKHANQYQFQHYDLELMKAPVKKTTKGEEKSYVYFALIYFLHFCGELTGD